MSARSWPIVLSWTLIMALCALVVARAHYRADLSAFLPRAPSAMQQLLVRQLSNGPASRMILVGVDGADAATRAQVSRALTEALHVQPQIAGVANGASTADDRDRGFAFAHRYQLSASVTPERFSVGGLHAAIADSLGLLATPAGLATRALLPSDPTGETLEVIDQLTSGTAPHLTDGVWSSPDGQRALLIVQTRASGADTDAQARVIALIRGAFAHAMAAAHAGSLTLRMTGPGVFSVQARETIKREAVRLSLLSTALIATLLLLAYRSLPALAFGLLPVASGALAGVAAVSLGFGAVQGVTLGFGITLIGESVDYPIYLFVQSRGAQYRGVLWPTIVLGSATSICGFASLLPSAFPGLAQLGLYSIAGLTVAAAVTRWLLPALLPRGLVIAELEPLGNAARGLLARLHAPAPLALLLALACAAVLVLHRHELWNRDLAALSPVPAAAVRLDAQLRSQLGAPDVSNLVVISAASEQAVLATAESAGDRLNALVASQVIGGYDSPARYLPSRATQLRRLASLPDPAQLQARLTAAAVGLPVSPGIFAPFLRQVAAARRAGPITLDSLQGTALGLAVDGLLWHDAHQWHALLPLHPPPSAALGEDLDMARVRAALATLAPSQLQVVNTRVQSDLLYASYLHAALRLALLGLLAIIVLLAITLRSVRRVTRVVAPLVLAVLVVCALFALTGTAMTILHLIGLLLIVAVGSNYALFFDRSAAAADRDGLPRTLASLLLANAGTVLGFGVLATSSVPVLSALGRTVAPGTLLALVFAALLAPRTLFEPAPLVPAGTLQAAHGH